MGKFLGGITVWDIAQVTRWTDFKDSEAVFVAGDFGFSRLVLVRATAGAHIVIADNFSGDFSFIGKPAFGKDGAVIFSARTSFSGNGLYSGPDPMRDQIDNDMFPLGELSSFNVSDDGKIVYLTKDLEVIFPSPKKGKNFLSRIVRRDGTLLGFAKNIRRVFCSERSELRGQEPEPYPSLSTMSAHRIPGFISANWPSENLRIGGGL